MIVAGMATQPTRTSTSATAINSILPQVDRLWLCLDGFKTVPSFAIHPKIHYEFGHDHGELKAEGKFLGLALDRHAEVFVAVDDDILYPRNYVKRLLFFRKLLRKPFAVGCGGAVFHQPVRSYLYDKKRWPARRRQLLPLRTVDLLNTNGTLHLVFDLKFDPRSWGYQNQVDLNFLEEALKAAVKFALPPRRTDWVKPLAEKQEDSVYLALTKNDDVQTKRINDLLLETRNEAAGLRRQSDL